MAKSKSTWKLNLSLTNVLTSVLFAVVGILLIFLKGGSLGILMTVTGAILIVMGILEIINGKNWLAGIIYIGIGVAIIVLGWLIVDILLLILGIVLCVKGVIDIVSFYKKGFMACLPAIILIVIGILLIFTKIIYKFLDIICIIAGVILILNAVLNLFGKPIVKRK